MKTFLLSVAALFTVTALIIISLAPNFVSADEYGQSGGASWGEKDKAAGNMPMGVHRMGATVESVDHTTGFLKLKTGMGEMTIHYPAPAVKDLNKGDKITVNLSYTKDEGKKDDGMMKMK